MKWRRGSSRRWEPRANPMPADLETGRAELERLTVSARDAAKQGRWDLVDECYRTRDAAMRGAMLLPQDAERMLAIDREVQGRALAAKTALAELLRESLGVRLRLRGLRHGAGGPATGSGTIVREA
jgi:hypothetical protein